MDLKAVSLHRFGWQPWLLLATHSCRACLLVDSATFLMASLASISIDLLADPDGSRSVQRVLVGALWIIAAIAARIVIGRVRSKSAPALGKHAEQVGCNGDLPLHQAAPPLSKWWVVGLAMLTLAPLAMEPCLRIVLGEGRPLEIQMILGLRNLALALAALSLWPRCARLSAAVSLCLMLFAQVIDEDSSATWLLGPFAIAGGLWLLVSYQAKFANLVTAASESKAISSRTSRRLPLRGFAYAGVILFAFAGLWFAGPRAPLFTLGEWVGSSGGTGDNDPFARGGVNDGQEEVGGENPETTGFAETDKFLDSDKPTLYDAASDLYGEPVKRKNKLQERMISVTASDVREIKNQAESKRASREFSAARKSPRRPRKRPEDREARALFEVEGRTPLHLRMDILADYDGVSWKSLLNEPCPNVIEQVGQTTQMRLLASHVANCYGSPETHKLKIASISGALAPTPTLLSQFRVGLIDRADHFEWRRDGVLCFKGRTNIPAGTTVETNCRTASLGSLTSEDLAGPHATTMSAYRDLPKASRASYAAIAQEWVGHLPRGPAQVSAIIARLRNEYYHDPLASYGHMEGDPVLDFLSSHASGPDYLFASAAVLILRSQGYSARLAIGYYASPKAFDSWTRHTPVQQEDIHFWPEILLSDGNWLALEPTPGYEVLLPQPSLIDRALSALSFIATTLIHHPWLALASFLTILVGFIYRLECVDAIQLAQLRLIRKADWRRRVLASMQLLESRAAVLRVGREKGQTLANWASQFASSSPEEFRRLRDLVSLAQTAAYGPLQENANAEAICQLAENTWTLRKFRDSAKQIRPVRPDVTCNLTLSSLAVAPT